MKRVDLERFIGKYVQVIVRGNQSFVGTMRKGDRWDGNAKNWYHLVESQFSFRLSHVEIIREWRR